MKLVIGLFVAHLAALIFGLAGLLIALPNPQLWATQPWGPQVFAFGMQWAGQLHMVLGAAAMLAFGWRWLGARRTLIFFAVSTLLSLSFEMVGTGTGWPFGNYAYLDGLGPKVNGQVPYTIPLSWFYVGFASYLLGTVIAARWWPRALTAASLGLGVWLLTVWDLVLDPAMAHDSLRVQFWQWFESGPYFGMPLHNFVGWSVTGLAFMAISRWLWRGDAAPNGFPAWVPFGVYAANLLFAVGLSLSVGLWQPVVLAVVLGLLPALLAWRAQAAGGQPPLPARPPAETGPARA